MASLLWFVGVWAVWEHIVHVNALFLRQCMGTKLSLNCSNVQFEQFCATKKNQIPTHRPLIWAKMPRRRGIGTIQ